MIQQAISKNAITLGIFAIITAGLLATINESTKSKIAANEREELIKSLSEVLPDDFNDNDLLATTYPVLNTKLGYKKERAAYIALKKGQPQGVVLQVAALEGYNGKLNLLVGINSAAELTGVRVISHKETPGLGDSVNIKKSNWILSFNGKSLANTTAEQWAVKKDGGVFDSFTGATITPRAVIKGVYQGLQFYNDEHANIYSSASEKP